MNNKFVTALTTIVFVSLLMQLVYPYKKSSSLPMNLGRKISYQLDVVYLAKDRFFVAKTEEEEQSAPTSTKRGGRR